MSVDPVLEVLLRLLLGVVGPVQLRWRGVEPDVLLAMGGNAVDLQVQTVLLDRTHRGLLALIGMDQREDQPAHPLLRLGPQYVIIPPVDTQESDGPGKV